MRAKLDNIAGVGPHAIHESERYQKKVNIAKRRARRSVRHSDVATCAVSSHGDRPPQVLSYANRFVSFESGHSVCPAKALSPWLARRPWLPSMQRPNPTREEQRTGGTDDTPRIAHDRRICSDMLPFAAATGVPYRGPAAPVAATLRPPSSRTPGSEAMT